MIHVMSKVDVTSEFDIAHACCLSHHCSICVTRPGDYKRAASLHQVHAAMLLISLERPARTVWLIVVLQFDRVRKLFRRTDVAAE